jgi:hypothetical protein
MLRSSYQGDLINLEMRHVTHIAWEGGEENITCFSLFHPYGSDLGIHHYGIIGVIARRIRPNVLGWRVWFLHANI